MIWVYLVFRFIFALVFLFPIHLLMCIMHYLSEGWLELMEYFEYLDWEFFYYLEKEWGWK